MVDQRGRRGETANRRRGLCGGVPRPRIDVVGIVVVEVGVVRRVVLVPVIAAVPRGGADREILGNSVPNALRNW